MKKMIPKNYLQKSIPFERKPIFIPENPEFFQGCDNCGSNSFIESNYGIVCRNCGLTINMLVFRNDIRFNLTSPE